MVITTANYLSDFARPFLARVKVRGNKRVREKKILTRKVKGLGTRKNAQRPLTSQGLSAAEESRAFQPVACGYWFPDAPMPGLSSRTHRGGRARNGLSSGRSKAAGQIPPPAPPVQSILLGKRRFSGGASGGEGKSKLLGSPDRCLGERAEEGFVQPGGQVYTPWMRVVGDLPACPSPSTQNGPQKPGWSSGPGPGLRG